MRTIMTSIGIASLMFFSEIFAGDKFMHSEDNFASADWQQVVRTTGGDGSASGTSSRVTSGGNPGAHRKVFGLRAPASANDDSAVFIFQFANDAVYDPATMGSVDRVDISLDAKLLDGSAGTVVPALKQGGTFYVAAGKSVAEEDWTMKEFTGLGESSFGEIGDPVAHPDFSAAGEPITFGYAWVITAPTEQADEGTAGIDNWLLVVNADGLAAFAINAGLNDAWVNANAPFQGFFFTVYPDLGLFFLAWFTFDSMLPDENAIAEFGAPDQRWITGAGFYAGDSVALNAELTTGGIFNGSNPMATQQPNYGSITIQFLSCSEAILTYNFPSLGQSGQMTLTRALPDNEGGCEKLLAEM